jgi:hypothetical protein
MHPKPGDIVIARIEGPGETHALGVLGNPSQVACRTYRDALAAARHYAMRARVDAWFADDQDRFTLLSSHRIGSHEPSHPVPGDLP